MALDSFGINPGYLLMQILGISILIMVMRALVYDPMLRVLEERKERIAKGLEDAREAKLARDNADAEAKKVMEGARSEAAKARQEAAAQAENTAKGIINEANEEAKKVIATAQVEAEGERNRILSELRGQVAAISIAAAQKIVGATLDEDRQRALITDFFSAVPESVASMSGATAEVTSALPLTDDEVAAAKKSIKAEEVSFNVDPSILGGLIVKVGDQVVDNSVASQMSGLSSSLK